MHRDLGRSVYLAKWPMAPRLLGCKRKRGVAPMRRCLIPAFIVAAAMSYPLTAFAQNNCPPGAWFCEAEEVDPGQQAPQVAPDESDALPPPPPTADELPEVDALPPPPPLVRRMP